jgi:restriction system protein
MQQLLVILCFVGLIGLVWRVLRSNQVQGNRVEVTTTKPLPPQEDPQARHVRNTLAFAKKQHEVLTAKQREQATWQRTYGQAKVNELDQLSGTEFEAFLAGLFRTEGYSAELTPHTGDYGADLLLVRNGKRVAVQAKRYAGSVGIAAVQEALSGQAYYRCDIAWVITTGTFTPNAVELAKQSGVRLIERGELGQLIASKNFRKDDHRT